MLDWGCVLVKRLPWLLPAALCTPFWALAQPAAPSAPASSPHRPLDAAATVDQHDAAARQHYRAQRYEDALREYEAAYRLSMEPIFLFNIAQVLRAKGSYPEAVAKYELFVQLQKDPANPERLQALSYIRDVKLLMEMQDRERAARERARLAQESERVAREREQIARERERLARERERELLAREKDRRGRGFRAKLTASPSFRSLYGTSFLGVDGGFMLGGQIPRFGSFFSLDYFVGSNLSGMLTMVVRPGLTLEGIVDRAGRFRVGGSLYLSIVAIDRVTGAGYLRDAGGGVSVHGSVDVVRWGERAMYLGLRLGVDGLSAANESGARAVMVDLTTLFGFRL